MLLSSESTFTNIFSVVVVIIAGIITFYKWKFSYWKERGLPYVKPSFPFGTMENPIFRTMPLGSWLKQNYDEMKSLGYKHVGLYNFWSPVYMPIDPDYVKNVMQSDFGYFTDRGLYYNEKDDPLTVNIFNLEGGRWKKLREKLTPFFTTSKMKMMFDTVIQCTYPMKKMLDDFADTKLKIDIKDFVSRYTTDVIGSIGFGLECNSFKNLHSEFIEYGKKVFIRNKLTALKFAITSVNHAIGHKLRICTTPQDVSTFFINVINEVVNYRKINKIVRSDILQLLINTRCNQNFYNTKEIYEANTTIQEIAAQAFTFYLAGYETSSATIAHCLFELSKNQTLQENVRNEINDVLSKHKETFTYEALLDMQSLDKVVEETMRIYPLLAILTRKCTKDYKVPGTDVIIEKGTTIIIPVEALHYDPDYYPNPEKFNPERFSKENRKQIHPYTNLSFGEGRRKCLGLRFAMMLVKIALKALIRDYKFTVNDQTQIPLIINKYTTALKESNTVWLNAEKINY